MSSRWGPFILAAGTAAGMLAAAPSVVLAVGATGDAGIEDDAGPSEAPIDVVGRAVTKTREDEVPFNPKNDSRGERDASVSASNSGQVGATSSTPASGSRSEAVRDGGPRTRAALSHAAIVSLANDRGVVCTGSLIAPSVVLTARHCLPLRSVRFGIDPAHPDAAIEVGSSVLAPMPLVDMALLVLKRASAIPPLPYRRSVEDLSPGTFLRLVGFGATDSNGDSGMKSRHFVDVPATRYGCARGDEASYGCRPAFEMVLPRYFGNDTCSGDSGGPVLEQRREGLRIVAVTSRAVIGAVQRCGDGGIYTRTDMVAPWIDGVLREVNAR